MKLINVKSDAYNEYNVDSNAKKAEYEIRDPIRILKCKNIFAKGYRPNWSEEVFKICKFKQTMNIPC